MRAKITYEEFLRRARNAHGDTYDYSKSRESFTGTNKKVTIICPVHGEFQQRGVNHTSGSGCKKCSLDIRAGINRMTHEEFIEKAIAKHKNKYSYDEAKYVNSRNHVIITCPEHGNFSQLPGQHLFGTGCPKCAHNYSTKKKNILEVSAPNWKVPK